MGTSVLGRVMAKPTEEFWNNTVHMMNLNYMYQNRYRGIMFSSTGNNTLRLVAYAGASNKPDLWALGRSRLGPTAKHLSAI